MIKKNKIQPVLSMGLEIFKGVQLMDGITLRQNKIFALLSQITQLRIRPEKLNSRDTSRFRIVRVNKPKVSGTVRLKLYKGSATVVGRKSPFSLYSERHVTFEDDAGAYDQKDAAGFIKLNALRLRLLATRDKA